ncbi:MBL fold metallo-hydrolase [Methanothermococcus okinawensis]|uniref:RNA-metabolising metallo-beta-lactamase n=1 Tax=Methanothermococcus okinawensis (strain DSM 14208 / JCM 11175 / IH1) TaxID=647113 RepID=F8AK69_METOI|nr:MBL fold metallo-hydrolase [Methanothermococcus okinawensis]AEH07438.1 RNA-metabolising metallo-beta-lactamase [Methanothermococcus okinawensis IH1]
MDILFRGGAMEVGRSCIEVRSDKSNIFLDCGVKLSEDNPEYPVFDKIHPDAVFVSHAHLDHTGSLPILSHLHMHCPVYTTSMTKAITKELLRDSLKIGIEENRELPFNKGDINNILHHHKYVKYGEIYNIRDFEYIYYDAGHIPGSASIYLNYNNGKKIVYTGDIKLSKTRLTKGADLSYCDNDIDILIIESTYGNRLHPNRKQLEKEFLNKVKETVERGGTAIIPVFAVDRSQEVILMLNDLDLDVPIYFDGLGVKITKIMLGQHPKYLRNHKKLKRAFSNTYTVENEERHYVIKDLKENGGIIVSTAGMLNGGPVIKYISNFWNDPKSSLIFTGYQVKNTAGRILLETGKLPIGEMMVEPKFEISFYEFSAHAGMDELRTVVKKANPEILIIQHGEEEAINVFKEWAIEEGFKTYTPKLCDRIDI